MWILFRAVAPELVVFNLYWW